MNKLHCDVRRSGLIRREWRWGLRAGNGEIIASGERYRERRKCVASVERLQGLVPSAVIREVAR